MRRNSTKNGVCDFSRKRTSGWDISNETSQEQTSSTVSLITLNVPKPALGCLPSGLHGEMRQHNKGMVTTISERALSPILSHAPEGPKISMSSVKKNFFETCTNVFLTQNNL